jgi:CheY-like chemotaxis protein
MPKILVIDDVETMRDSICQMLRASGYETVEAADGRTGLLMLEQHNPDVVVTDILMPDKEGLETIRELVKSNPQVPVIAMTGAVNHVYLDIALSFGAAGILQKPFGHDELMSVVGSALKNSPT